MPNTSPLELYECVALVEYLNILLVQGKILEFSHTANETYTKSWSQKRKNTQLGVRKGLPDYVVITKKTLLFIEMKRLKGGIVSPEQKKWIESLYSVGVIAEVCIGFDNAKTLIDKHL